MALNWNRDITEGHKQDHAYDPTPSRVPQDDDSAQNDQRHFEAETKPLDDWAAAEGISDMRYEASAWKSAKNEGDELKKNDDVASDSDARQSKLQFHFQSAPYDGIVDLSARSSADQSNTSSSQAQVATYLSDETPTIWANTSENTSTKPSSLTEAPLESLSSAPTDSSFEFSYSPEDTTSADTNISMPTQDSSTHPKEAESSAFDQEALAADMPTDQEALAADMPTISAVPEEAGIPQSQSYSGPAFTPVSAMTGRVTIQAPAPPRLQAPTKQFFFRKNNKVPGKAPIHSTPSAKDKEPQTTHANDDSTQTSKPKRASLMDILKRPIGGKGSVTSIKSRGSTWPTKTAINLYIRPDNGWNLLRTLPLAVALTVGVAVFIKFGIIDQYQRVSVREAELQTVTSEVDQLKSLCTDYDEVKEIYDAYNVQNSSTGVDVLAALDLVDTYVKPSVTVNTISISDTTLTLQISGTTLKTIGSLATTLMDQSQVSSVTFSTANNTSSGSSSDVSASMTITLRTISETNAQIAAAEEDLDSLTAGSNAVTDVSDTTSE